jgi:dihydroxyacetone kinase-like protein
MSKSELNCEETRQMFMRVAVRMEESKDMLSEADRAVGDGDHGVGMARGFAAVQQKLQQRSFAALDELLKAVGMALLTSIGGAAGAVFGALFMGGARSLKGQDSLTSEVLSLFLNDGLQAVQERGKARVGDKTMVDALALAAQQAQTTVALPLDEALPSVAEAARQGMEKTKQMVAAVGKARTLGERSLGYADPGAISMYLILSFMAEYVLNGQPADRG